MERDMHDAREATILGLQETAKNADAYRKARAKSAGVKPEGEDTPTDSEAGHEPDAKRRKSAAVHDPAERALWDDFKGKTEQVLHQAVAESAPGDLSAVSLTLHASCQELIQGLNALLHKKREAASTANDAGMGRDDDHDDGADEHSGTIDPELARKQLEALRSLQEPHAQAPTAEAQQQQGP